MLELQVEIKKLNDSAILPKQMNPGDAGFDLHSAQYVKIWPGETKKIRTGIAIHISNPNHVGLIYARSSVATKQGLRPANCVGVVDSCYQGEWIVALHNDSDIAQEIKVGQRIAQAVIQPITIPVFKVVDRFSETTERGTGGFGSTGK